MNWNEKRRGSNIARIDNALMFKGWHQAGQVVSSLFVKLNITNSRSDPTGRHHYRFLTQSELFVKDKKTSTDMGFGRKVHRGNSKTLSSHMACWATEAVGGYQRDYWRRKQSSYADGAGGCKLFIARWNFANVSQINTHLKARHLHRIKLLIVPVRAACRDMFVWLKCMALSAGIQKHSSSSFTLHFSTFLLIQSAAHTRKHTHTNTKHSSHIHAHCAWTQRDTSTTKICKTSTSCHRCKFHIFKSNTHTQNFKHCHSCVVWIDHHPSVKSCSLMIKCGEGKPVWCTADVDENRFRTGNNAHERQSPFCIYKKLNYRMYKDKLNTH